MGDAKINPSRLLQRLKATYTCPEANDDAASMMAWSKVSPWLLWMVMAHARPQGILAEGALYLGFYLLGLLIDLVGGVLPRLSFHQDRLLIAWAEHFDMVVIQIHNTADATVIIQSFQRTVVLDEHHLSANL